MAKAKPVGGAAWNDERRVERGSRGNFARRAAPPWAGFDDEQLAEMDKQIDDLKGTYDATGNPTYVWEAIACLGARSDMTWDAVALPAWVAAYLVRSAQMIVGAAGIYRRGDRRKPPSREPKGKRRGAGPISLADRLMDEFLIARGITDHAGARGLTAAQRRDMLLEALGFKGTQGWQPLAAYHRDREDAALLREREKAKAEGKTARELLPDHIDPHRRLRRIKSKHRPTGEK